ncbi:MAG: 4Fe-4S binding protein [bacterium]
MKLSIIRRIVKLISLILLFPILIPIKFCPYSFPWIACSGCNLLYCPAKTLRNPILYIAIPLSLSGRLFCRFLCPAGTIQDITNNISRKISGPDIRLYSNPYIKYVFLAFILVLCFDLDASFFPSCYYWILPLFGIFLFLSSFTARYWCVFLCPIGFVLSIFRLKRK